MAMINMRQNINGWLSMQTHAGYRNALWDFVTHIIDTKQTK
jgi:hypothetical protein